MEMQSCALLMLMCPSMLQTFLIEVLWVSKTTVEIINSLFWFYQISESQILEFQIVN